MSDSLRTRIAAVQQAHHLRMDPNHPAWGYCRCGLNVGFQDRADEPVPEFEWWVIHARHVADAVIRELRLKPETRIGPGEPGEGLSGFIRYVTEWETDV